MKVHKRVLFGALCLFFVAALSGSNAEEVWRVVDGRMTFHFYTEKLERWGITLTNIEETVQTPPRIEMNMEPPYISFDITEQTDLMFRVSRQVLAPQGIVEGTIRHAGGLSFEVDGSRTWELKDFVIEYAADGSDATAAYSDAFRIRNGVDNGLSLIDLHNARAGLLDGRLILAGLDVRISGDWADALNRPELDGMLIGTAEIACDAELIESSGVDELPYIPAFAGGPGDTVDVKLGILDNVDEVAREGTYPNGVAAVSMATTSCNVGNVDVPWEAPMGEDHPGIGMQLYRETDTGPYTTFEQIGFSAVKHGFFALSSSQCTPCQNPSDGTYLGVGCSDTYGVGNNADRTWLGPRDEWDPFNATWECTGSHFSDYQPDCTRRHGGSGHSATEHRVAVADGDLDNANSTYYYEAAYLVRQDELRMNNIGSRRTVMSWQGNGWDFDTPGGNPLLEGPAVLRWDADLHTWANVPDDGRVILSVKATDIGGGQYHYEYALFNFDSKRRIRSITLPVNAASSVTDIEFHDGDLDPANDWTYTQSPTDLTFETETIGENPDANALRFCWLFNFRFNADAPPENINATLGVFETGAGDVVLAKTLAPGSAASVENGLSVNRIVRLLPSRPNPLSPTTTVRFNLAQSVPVKLDVFSASGRHVRSLVDEVMESGSHNLIWDGNSDGGRRVSAGVYYYLLRAGKETARQSVVVVK